jgi:putative aminopeptidase FrvX
MKTYDLLKELTETPGPSGFESNVGALVQKTWEPFADEINVDRVGSIIALKKGQGTEPRSKILLAAHLDEIGLMVSKMESYPATGSGFLRVTSLGGVDPRQLFGQKVVVHGSKKGNSNLEGVIGSLPPQMLPANQGARASGLSNLVVDLGLPLKKIQEAVSVGDSISFVRPLRKLLNKRVTGKALDNRLSLVVLTRCLQSLAKRSHHWDVYAVATAQEETVLLGAYTSAFNLEPDAAVAIDVTYGKGPGVTEDIAFDLGDGPSIGTGPNVHPGVFKSLRDTADKIELKTHIEPHSRMSGTDLIGLQVARQGVPTGLVSIPIRYMHTAVETASLVDVKRAARLLVEFIVGLDDAFLQRIEDELMGKSD